MLSPRGGWTAARHAFGLSFPFAPLGPMMGVTEGFFDAWIAPHVHA